MNKFTKLGLSEELTEYLTELGINEPTPIQEKAIPIVFEGKDLIGQAQTGTGKTFAFLFPILEKINLELPHTQALIVAPTRELAIQITAEARRIVSEDFGVLAVYGGQDVDQQARKLKGGAHLIIATPGRLLDHLRRGTINLEKIDFLVLDEADQMLHIGFLHEVEDIINQTPQSRQTLLFSATMPEQIQSLAKRYMKKPEIIRIKAKRITLDEIEQVVIETTDRGKLNALLNQFKETQPYLAIIFCRTKRRANKLNEQLKGKGLLSEELHGDLTQGKREKVMKLFREAKIQYLVATDVAARGIDVEGVTHVFNYDIPQDTESYVHRIGRTGRAGETGIAITFVTSKDFQEMRMIEKELNLTIKRINLVEKEDSRESRDRDSKDSRDSRDSRDSKGTRDSRDSRGSRESRDTGVSRDSRDSRGSILRSDRPNRDLKTSNGPRSQRESHQEQRSQYADKNRPSSGDSKQRNRNESSKRQTFSKTGPNKDWRGPQKDQRNSRNKTANTKRTPR
ncbi:DEAD/DEAH box helicase [Bacillus sp. EAC]|uniref:DEAD/DEAH box helicase n=1 Tax=Bacillus sp. EAC TaxID=1978338 RepID=UPI000B437CA1|nr:DEAD/DEAH box helicase [Bacillus sp. EAC]